MLLRFALYGFLKNQRYFEAFLVLALLDRGLDFFRIGLLIALREAVVILLEVPSGAIADVWGRRRCMIVSFAAYIASFIVLGAAHHLGLLAAGMLLYGVGDAFRTGTHKAMILAWLRRQGRASERVRVYGYTRSWSKFGSAAAVVVAALIVLIAGDYRWVFYAAVVPYVAGIINFLGYPRELDESAAEAPSVGAVVRHLAGAVGTTVRRPPLRRLFAEAMGFDGIFAAVKGYLQPVLEALAIGLAASTFGRAGWSDVQRTAILVGAVYFVLYLLSGAASRASHRVVRATGGEANAARLLWIAASVVYAVLAAAGWLDALVALVVAFVLLDVLHNLWRPVLIGRFDAAGTEAQGASLLSIEGQARRIATALAAPVLGLAVDGAVGAAGAGPYWPVGAVGLLVALIFVAMAPRDSGGLGPPKGHTEGGVERSSPR